MTTFAAAKSSHDEETRVTPQIESLSSEFPQAWYLVARSRDIAAGGVKTCMLAGRPIVVFRGVDGTLHSLDAHCPHMGTHLAGGTVVENCLRCPMHHWKWDGQGRCQGQSQRQRAWPVSERLGSIFVFFGEEPTYELPSFTAAPLEELQTAAGKAVAIDCSWLAIAANGFDMQHLRAVHERALREPPSVEQLDRYRLRLRYVSRVTGTGMSDRVMKWLSNDCVRVTITCWGGTMFTVESVVGKMQSMLLLGIMPTTGGVAVTPVVVMKRSSLPLWTSFKLMISKWLFTRFLEKDMTSLRGMKFHRPAGLPAEEPMGQFFSYADHLPVARVDLEAIATDSDADTEHFDEPRRNERDIL